MKHAKQYKPSHYVNIVHKLLQRNFITIDLSLTKPITIDKSPQCRNYDGVYFSLNHNKCIYRKAKLTPDRPGSFLTLWQRPDSSNTTNKPIAFSAAQLNYLFVQVMEDKVNDVSNTICRGLFIFPASVLIREGIIRGSDSRGKTGFRVFPPWSRNRGNHGTKIFSASGKKTKAWQLPYYVEIDSQGKIHLEQLNDLLHLIDFK